MSKKLLVSLTLFTKKGQNSEVLALLSAIGLSPPAPLKMESSKATNQVTIHPQIQKISSLFQENPYLENIWDPQNLELYGLF